MTKRIILTEATMKKAGIPDQYKNNYVAKQRPDGTIEIIFGSDSDHRHGHVVLDVNEDIEYYRAPNAYNF